jgi:hypothetical protein
MRRLRVQPETAPLRASPRHTPAWRRVRPESRRDETVGSTVGRAKGRLWSICSRISRSPPEDVAGEESLQAPAGSG